MRTATQASIDPAKTIPDLRAVIQRAVETNPRTLQKTLGPSELGIGCDRCLLHLLAGHSPVENGMPWLPTIGNAVHDWLELEVVKWLQATGSDRYIPEGRVTVGQLRGVDITGHSDLFDVHTGTVVDFKIVGATTLKKVRRDGASLTYRRQAHLYGRGWARAGYAVQSVAIWFLPRNDISIDGGIVWQEPYDEQVAVDALDRATMLAAFIDAYGVDTVLAGAPAHTGGEFSCGRFTSHGDAPPPSQADIERQLDGLIPSAATVAAETTQKETTSP